MGFDEGDAAAALASCGGVFAAALDELINRGASRMVGVQSPEARGSRRLSDVI